MRTVNLIIVVVMLISLLSACGEKKHTAATRTKRTDFIIHDDPGKLSEKLNLPAAISSARWTVMPFVPQSRLDIGPSDYCLYAVISVDSAQWPIWERALIPLDSSAKVYLMEEVAEKLLPPEWLATTTPDSLERGRLISGTYFQPDSLASGGYQPGVAVRHGKYLYLSFSTM